MSHLYLFLRKYFTHKQTLAIGCVLDIVCIGVVVWAIVILFGK